MNFIDVIKYIIIKKGSSKMKKMFKYMALATALVTAVATTVAMSKKMSKKEPAKTEQNNKNDDHEFCA